jgi:hypothetical protein
MRSGGNDGVLENCALIFSKMVVFPAWSNPMMSTCKFGRSNSSFQNPAINENMVVLVFDHVWRGCSRCLRITSRGGDGDVEMMCDDGGGGAAGGGGGGALRVEKF